ncbi:Uncharacterised protein [Klebsiella pneumoniae]|nr:Uncharacterised protein [Klebsiella pneumoniae]
MKCSPVLHWRITVTSAVNFIQQALIIMLHESMTGSRIIGRGLVKRIDKVTEESSGLVFSIQVIKAGWFCGFSSEAQLCQIILRQKLRFRLAFRDVSIFWSQLPVFLSGRLIDFRLHLFQWQDPDPGRHSRILRECTGCNILFVQRQPRRILQPERVFLPHLFRVGQEFFKVIIHAGTFNMHLISRLISPILWGLIVAHMTNRITGSDGPGRRAHNLVKFHNLFGRRHKPAPP